MLDHRQQRVLDELERDLEAAPAGGARPTGFPVLGLMVAITVALVVAGAAVAAFALAAATAICWLFWALCTHRLDGVPARPDGPGASVRRYLRWLSEAE